MIHFLKNSVAFLALAATAHAGSLSVSNSKGFSSNPLVDRTGSLLESTDPVVIAVGSIDPEPATTPGASISSSAYATILSNFTPYGSSTSLVASAAPLNLKGVFNFQDYDPGAGTTLNGKTIYVIVARGTDLATASEVAILKTSAVFENTDDTNPAPKLVGIGTGLGTVAVVGSDSHYSAVATTLDGTPDAAYSLAVVGSAPSDLSLSSDEFTENENSGSTVGTLSATDLDPADSFTYSMVAGANDTHNALFAINGNQLLTAAVFDHELQASASIRVRVVDNSGLQYEEALTVSVADDRNEDFDEDGLTEAQEEDTYGTSDTDSDNDNDGFEDGYEVAHGFDPTSNLDGTGDRDGDRWPDWLEVRLGTDPDVKGPGLTMAVSPNGGGKPAVQVGPGRNLLGFRVERATTMKGPWMEVADYPTGLPLGQTLEWIDNNPPTESGFYRVGAYPLKVAN